MDNEYEVGYGKPPGKNQFQPGRSGNPNGRPKGSKNTYTLLNEALSKQIEVQENGKTVKISKKSAIIIQLINKAVKGETRAINALLPHMLMADMKEEERNQVLSTLNQDDKAIIESFLSKHQKAEYPDE